MSVDTPLAAAIVFGRVRHPATALCLEGADLRAAGRSLGRQVAWVEEGTPAFRLNSPFWLSPGLDIRAGLIGPAALRIYVRHALTALCPIFAASARDFVAAYLDRLDDVMPPSPPAEDLRHEIGFAADLYHEALLPFPAARIGAGTEGGGWHFAECDIAFWDGATIHAFVLQDAASLRPSRRAVLDRLREGLGPRLSVTFAPGARRGDLPATAPAPPAAGSSARAADAPTMGPIRDANLLAPLPDRPL